MSQRNIRVGKDPGKTEEIIRLAVELTRELLQQQPKDISEFLATYLETQLKRRQRMGA